MSRMLISVLAMALAACAVQDGPVDASGLPGAASSEAGYNPLPAGLRLPPDYHLREDRFHVTKRKGHLRRRVALEVLDRDQGQAIEDIERLMHVGGYRVSGDPEASRKGTKLKFRRKGHPTITVEFRSDVGKKPANPRARHLVVMEWKVSDALDEWLARDPGNP